MTRIRSLTLALLASAGIMFAQGGWRRFGDQPPAPATQQAAAAESQDPTQPVASSDSQAQRPAPNSPNDPPRYGLPPQLTIKPGTFVMVRVDQMLSSNRNQPGDVFSATLMQPMVVDGVVVAQRGQTVMGRVAEAQKSKAGHDSRLGLELTGLTLADGTQATVHSQLVARQGPTTPSGQEVGTVATTTAVGATRRGCRRLGHRSRHWRRRRSRRGNHRRPADAQPPHRRLSGNRADVSHRDAGGHQHHARAAGLPLRGSERLPAPG